MPTFALSRGHTLVAVTVAVAVVLLASKLVALTIDRRARPRSRCGRRASPSSRRAQWSTSPGRCGAPASTGWNVGEGRRRARARRRPDPPRRRRPRQPRRSGCRRPADRRASPRARRAARRRRSGRRAAVAGPVEPELGNRRAARRVARHRPRHGAEDRRVPPEHGAFRSVDELDAIPGIGPARLENLRGLVVPMIPTRAPTACCGRGRLPTRSGRRHRARARRRAVPRPRRREPRADPRGRPGALGRRRNERRRGRHAAWPPRLRRRTARRARLVVGQREARRPGPEPALRRDRSCRTRGRRHHRADRRGTATTSAPRACPPVRRRHASTSASSWSSRSVARRRREPCSTCSPSSAAARARARVRRAHLASPSRHTRRPARGRVEAGGPARRRRRLGDRLRTPTRNRRSRPVSRENAARSSKGSCSATTRR